MQSQLVYELICFLAIGPKGKAEEKFRIKTFMEYNLFYFHMYVSLSVPNLITNYIRKEEILTIHKGFMVEKQEKMHESLTSGGKLD